MRSPCSSAFSRVGTPLTRVPFRLSRSRICNFPSARQMEQCFLETSGSLRATGFVGSLPIVVSVSARGIVVPLSGPVIAISRGSMEMVILADFQPLAKIPPERFGFGSDNHDSRVAAHTLLHAVRFQEPIEQRSLEVVDPG